MNPFVIELAKNEIPGEPDLETKKLVVEDNIGESIHLHYRNLRLDFTIEEFLKFEKEISNALMRLKDGDN